MRISPVTTALAPAAPVAAAPAPVAAAPRTSIFQPTEFDTLGYVASFADTTTDRLRDAVKAVHHGNVDKASRSLQSALSEADYLAAHVVESSTFANSPTAAAVRDASKGVEALYLDTLGDRELGRFGARAEALISTFDTAAGLARRAQALLRP